MTKPGFVLRRPVGSDGSFSEHTELPSDLGGEGRPTNASRKSARHKPKKTSAGPVDKAAERKAGLAYEREQRTRERERAKEEAARQKERDLSEMGHSGGGSGKSALGWFLIPSTEIISGLTRIADGLRTI